MQLGAPSIYSEEVLKKYTSPVCPKRNAPDGWTAKLRADVASLGIKGKEFHPVFNASLRRRVVLHDPSPGAWADTNRELASIFEDAPWFDDAEPEDAEPGSDSDSASAPAPPPPPPPPPPPLVLYGRVETFTDSPRIVEKYVVDKRAEGSGGLQVSPEFIKGRTKTRLAYADCLCRNPWLGEVDFTPIMPTLYEHNKEKNPRTVDSLALTTFRTLYRPPNRCESRGTLHDVNHGLGKTPRASDHSEEDLWTAYAYHLTKLPLDVHWKLTRDDEKRQGRCRLYTKHAFIDALRALRTPTTPSAGRTTNKNEVTIFFSVGTGHAQFLTAGEVALRTLCSSSAVMGDSAKWRVQNAPPGVLDAEQDAVELGCAEDDPLYPVAAQLESVPHAFSAVPCVTTEFGVAPVGFWATPIEYIMVGRDGRIRGREVVDRIGIVGTAFGKPGLFASPELEKMAASADLPSFTTTIRDRSAVARTVTARRGGIDPACFEDSAEVAERVVKSATVLPLVLRGTGKFGGLDFSRTLPRKPPTKRSASTSDSDANTVQLVPNIIGPMVDPGAGVAKRIRPHLQKRGKKRNSTTIQLPVIIGNLQEARDFFHARRKQKLAHVKDDPAELVGKADKLLHIYAKTRRLNRDRWLAQRIYKKMEIELDPNANRDQQNSGPQLLREQAAQKHAARATLAEAHALGHANVRVPPPDLDGRFGFTYVRALTPTEFNGRLDRTVAIRIGGAELAASGPLEPGSTHRLAIGFAAFLLEKAKEASVMSEIFEASARAPPAHANQADIEDAAKVRKSIEKNVNLLKTALPGPVYQKLARKLGFFDPAP
jgi:hypothetical protein